MPSYKWNNPTQWLEEKIQTHANQGDAKELYRILLDLLPNIDSDTIQKIYQDEMDEDGYFEDEDEKNMFRDRIHNWLENETNFLQISSREYAGPKMNHADYLRVEYGSSVDDLYRDHDGDFDEAIAQLS